MSKEKKISERVRYIEDDVELRIEIKGNTEKHKENIVLGWLMIWTIIGLSMIYYLFTQVFEDQQTKIAIYIFLGFWLYYFYKVFRAYRWLSAGFEEITLNDNTMQVLNRVGNRGLPSVYLISEMSKVQIRAMDIKSFQYQMENSFWVIGGDRLQIQHNGKPIYFGKKIEKSEARKLIRLINERIKKK